MAELSSNPAEANALAESNLTLSVVIPTYERESELEDCLASILQQYELPREVLLVDDSETECVQRIYTRRREEFAGAGVALRYLRTGRSPSLTAD